MFQDRIAHDLALIKVRVAYEKSVKQQRPEPIKALIEESFDAVKIYKESYDKYLAELEENGIGNPVPSINI